MRNTLILFATIASATLMSFMAKPSLVVTSSAFDNNSIIPVKYSCEGDEVSPPIHVADIPTETKTLALVLHDPDAPMKGGFTHWVMWNIDVSGEIPESYKNADQGMNGAKKMGYIGMCPPSGTHHYHVKVYALDTKLDIDKDTDKAGLEKAMEGHVLAQGELVGLYKKTK